MPYPCWKYNEEGESVYVASPGEDPGEGWADTPAAFGIITCPSVFEEEEDSGSNEPVPAKRGRPRKRV